MAGKGEKGETDSLTEAGLEISAGPHSELKSQGHWSRCPLPDICTEGKMEGGEWAEGTHQPAVPRPRQL